MMAGAWSLFPTSASKGVPLLYRFVSSSAGYELSLTDLTHLWSEKLDSKQIIRRATELSTTIDPGEDREQFGLLLSKIKDAFWSKEGSRLTLLSDDEKSGRLILKTETQLPEPFDPLRWSFKLEELPTPSITERVVLPLIEAAHFHEAQISSLKGLMEEKDWAIGKLLDKLETSNIDLNTIFPGQRFSRIDPTSNIRGMSMFNEKLWAERFKTKDSLSQVGVSISQSLADPQTFGDLKSSGPNWWSNLDFQSQQHGKPKEAKSSTADEVDDDTDVEAASTATKSKAHTGKIQRGHRGEDDSGSSSEVDTVTAKRGQIKRRRASSSPEVSSGAGGKPERQRKTLSMSGGPKSTAELHKKPGRKPSIDRSSDSEAEETASGDEKPHASRPKRKEDDEGTESKSESEGVVEKHTHSLKGGLGKLGGKKPSRKIDTKAKSPSESGEDSTASEPDTKLKHPPNKKHGLGKIGGKKKTETKKKPMTPDETATASEAESERGAQLPERHAEVTHKAEEEPSRKDVGEAKHQETIEKAESPPEKIDKDVDEGRHEDARKDEKPSKPIRAPVMPKKRRRF